MERSDAGHRGRPGMTATGRPSIGIVGAGIGGLAAALALRRAGLRARIFERAGRFTRVGAGLQMAPNVTKALRPLGVLDPLTRLACKPVAWRSYDVLERPAAIGTPGPGKPRFSGMVAYRGLVPASELSGLRIEPVAAKWWGHDRHLVHYFVSAGRELNFVAPVPSSGWDEESWTSPGRVTDLLADFGAFPPRVREAIARTSTLMRSALYDREPLPRWSYGRVSMLGDACHPMLPFMAQGAGAAIENAVVLSRCLRDADADGIPEALARYEQTRQPRASAMQAGSRGNEFLRDRGTGQAGAPAPSAAEIYDYDAWSQPLSGGRTIPAATTNAGRSQR